VDERSNVRLRYALPLLALLCVVAYAPALRLPLIEDDYPSLAQAQTLGGPGNLGALLHNTVFRVRATSVWSMYWLWKAAHFTPAVYHAFSLLLHILNTWLVFAIAMAWPRMRAAAFWAAAFFAVQEGHQEAVMWFTAINELWMFVFGAAALWWGVQRGHRIAGLVLFFLALISKESAIIFLPLFWLVEPNWRRLAPYAVLGAIVTGSIFLTRGASFRFADGSFSLHAPFWITGPRGVGRVLWIWGWIAAALIAWRGDREHRRSAAVAVVWIALALIPYVFLTYSTAIPSRQTYLATVGLGLLFGLALDTIARRQAVAALVALMLVHNIGYLWVKKRAQFIQRAEPTEQLIRMARETGGPIWVACFPRTDWIAKEAVHLGAGKPASMLVWSEAEARQREATAVFCYKEK
jgi:hypothetical protein